MVASGGGGVDGERPRERCEKNVKLKLCFLKSVPKLFSSLLAGCINYNMGPSYIDRHEPILIRNDNKMRIALLLPTSLHFLDSRGISVQLVNGMQNRSQSPLPLSYVRR